MTETNQERLEKLLKHGELSELQKVLKSGLDPNTFIKYSPVIMYATY